jgi:hypothetical protein
MISPETKAFAKGIGFVSERKNRKKSTDGTQELS